MRHKESLPTEVSDGEAIPGHARIIPNRLGERPSTNHARDKPGDNKKRLSESRRGEQRPYQSRMNPPRGQPRPAVRHQETTDCIRNTATGVSPTRRACRSLHDEERRSDNWPDRLASWRQPGMGAALRATT
ncbi:hypothetical protein BO78DRAFT_59910 [Aspergillus sclerotiicarbonarius CBS 121057]|uniref:Uncharacterized protein n=1 Tax=Aspergillus sclerotiicarbonarius (strain CBS 121057 / IBT 28362) TaxID=1448318 RepID=A0A319EEI8_ASPSB|nr:hypothetical protein BO78DRAFT_59910 [Aspergillus sclerotiicarbonarius CBS 121057]